MDNFSENPTQDQCGFSNPGRMHDWRCSTQSHTLLEWKLYIYNLYQFLQYDVIDYDVGLIDYDTITILFT